MLNLNYDKQNTPSADKNYGWKSLNGGLEIYFHWKLFSGIDCNPLSVRWIKTGLGPY